MPEKNDLERVIADLYDVIHAQNQAILYLITNDEAMVPALVELLDGFQAKFEANHAYKETHPGPIGQSLVALRGTLDEVERRLKRRIDGWKN